jgi:hypothetical protein
VVGFGGLAKHEHVRPAYKAPISDQPINLKIDRRRQRHHSLIVESGKRRIRIGNQADAALGTTRSTSHNNPAFFYDRITAGRIIAHTGDIVHKLNRGVKFSSITLHAPHWGYKFTVTTF